MDLNQKSKYQKLAYCPYTNISIFRFVFLVPVLRISHYLHHCLCRSNEIYIHLVILPCTFHRPNLSVSAFLRFLISLQPGLMKLLNPGNICIRSINLIKLCILQFEKSDDLTVTVLLITTYNRTTIICNVANLKIVPQFIFFDAIIIC